VLSIMPKILEISVGSQMERYVLVRIRDHLRRRSTLIGRTEISRSNLTNRFVALLLFSRFSLMWGIGERKRKW